MNVQDKYNLQNQLLDDSIKDIKQASNITNTSLAQLVVDKERLINVYNMNNKIATSLKSTDKKSRQLLNKDKCKRCLLFFLIFILLFLDALLLLSYFI